MPAHENRTDRKRQANLVARTKGKAVRQLARLGGAWQELRNRRATVGTAPVPAEVREAALVRQLQWLQFHAEFNTYLFDRYPELVFDPGLRAVFSPRAIRTAPEFATVMSELG